jgi:HAD superfamily phosphoserine phosphatase-like hydrolase
MTLIFDFDSTLINCESLEEIASRSPQLSSEQLNEIKELTEKAMNGSISFIDSLEARLSITQPSLKSIYSFIQNKENIWSAGSKKLIEDFPDVWVLTGGFEILVKELCLELPISQDKIYGVKATWNEDGAFEGLDKKNPFYHSKIEGARALKKHWSSPSVMIGDGMTDYEIFEQGLVDYFIVYKEHAYREEVIKKAPMQAKNMSELKICLHKIFS